jgi:hypothetical protein
MHVQVAQLASEIIGGGGDEAAHLVERLGPRFASRVARHPQDPHGLDISVPGLGLAVGVAGLGSPGGGDGLGNVCFPR